MIGTLTTLNKRLSQHKKDNNINIKNVFDFE